MEALELTLVLLAAVLVSAVIDQIVPKLSSPLIQIALGVVIAVFVGGQVEVTLNSELFLVLFIAPLLYDEARSADKAELWKQRRPVLSLAVGLVIVATLAVGFCIHWLVPSIPLAAAFALAAALGPTDAVAVSSLPKELNIGDRRRNVLKGECLINDASGIVSFQFALAAVVTGAFSLTQATLSFLISFLGGIVVGLVLGWLCNLILKKVRGMGLENTTFHVLFDVFTPFIVYLAAEPLHASGIIAVVCAGLVLSLSNRAIGPNISRLNIVSSSVWRVLSFSLNGIVFVLLGTQLPRAMQRTWDDVALNNGMLILYILVITLAVIAARFLWLLAMEHIRNQRMKKQGEEDGIQTFRELARSSAIMTLGGPKGTITLAIIFTIPVFTQAGNLFPQRNLIIFLASGVILCTLLLSNFVLPLLAPKREAKPGQQELHLQETEIRIEIFRSVIEELAAHQTPETRRATQAVIRSYNDRISRLKNRHDIDDEPNFKLRRMANDWQIEYVEGELKAKRVDAEVGYGYLSRLATIDDILEHHTSRWSIRARAYRTYLVALRRIGTFIKRAPVISLPEQVELSRKLQADAIAYAIGKLQETITTDIPTEDVSALILEYQRSLSALRRTASSPSPIATITKTANSADDIARIAYRFELEKIQERYEDGSLSRVAARRMRENVNLMILDLEDRV